MQQTERGFVHGCSKELGRVLCDDDSQLVCFDGAVQEFIFHALRRRQELLEEREHVVAWGSMRGAGPVFNRMTEGARKF